jgi:hypothetical protein
MPDWWRCSSPAAASSAIFMHDVQCSGFPLLDGRDPATTDQ